MEVQRISEGGLAAAFTMAATFFLALPAAGAPVVSLDPGHGGSDLGASLKGLREKEVALDFCRRLAAKLGARGLEPRLTREGDELVPLTERVERSQAAGARALVSIHVDETRRGRGRGVLFYVYGPNRLIPRGPPRREGEIFLPPPPAAQVAASVRLAGRLRGSVRAVGLRAGPLDRGAFAVLKGPDVPSVLVELGNIRDREESSRLRDPASLDALAAALAEGLASFLSESGAAVASR